LWACAACLFLSCLFKSRAMSGLVLGGAGVLLFLVFGFGRLLFFVASRGGGAASVGFGVPASQSWWVLAITTTFCLASMANLVLLAENRLSLPTENRVTPLRVGFLGQFLLIAAWTLSFLNQPPGVRSNAVEALGVIAGLHLALVAMFTVTEDLVVSRRGLLHMKPSSWRWLLAMFRPGGGRGAIYVLAQMAILLSAAWVLRPGGITQRWLLVMCGYICFFTGVPVVAFRLLQPLRAASLQLRVAVLVLLPVSMLLPDIVHYMLWRPAVVDLKYAARHLVNPLRTLANWPVVEANSWIALPVGLGLTGLLAYFVLNQMGAVAVQPAPIDPHIPEAETGEPDRANVLY